MKRHLRDEYVLRAQQDGYISRAAYKLKEICNKNRSILTNTTLVYDIGAAPGSWTQLACDAVQATSTRQHVISVDLLPMQITPDGSQFVQGDFSCDAVKESLLSKIQSLYVSNDQSPDDRAQDLKQLCILSDMRSNTSGNKDLDHARQVELCEHVLDFSEEANAIFKSTFGETTRSAIVLKMTMGQDFEAFRSRIRKQFKSHRIVKPKASRPKSPELYFVAWTW